MAVLALSVVPAAHAALVGRDLDLTKAGDEAYYDDVLNITWLADANYAKTTNYVAANSAGRMTWDEAKTWADDLVVGAYSDWRLPTMVDTGTAGCNFSNAGGTDCGYNVQTKGGSTGTVYSEMAHLYYVTLGNKSVVDASDNYQPDFFGGLQNAAGPFSNVQSGLYWSGVEYASYAGYAWSFYTYNGAQGPNAKNVEFSAWAVRPGDVAAAVVPEPQTYALMGLGLAAVLVARRRQHR